MSLRLIRARFLLSSSCFCFWSFSYNNSALMTAVNALLMYPRISAICCFVSLLVVSASYPWIFSSTSCSSFPAVRRCFSTLSVVCDDGSSVLPPGWLSVGVGCLCAGGGYDSPSDSVSGTGSDNVLVPLARGGLGVCRLCPVDVPEESAGTVMVAALRLMRVGALGGLPVFVVFGVRRS